MSENKNYLKKYTWKFIKLNNEDLQHCKKVTETSVIEDKKFHENFIFFRHLYIAPSTLTNNHN